MSKIIEILKWIWDKIKGIVQGEVAEVDEDSLDNFVGQKLFIRTVTYHLVGRVEKVVGKFFQLEDASFIANSGRFHNALKDGFDENAEIEPTTVPTWVNIEAITDMFVWKHDLPKKQQ